MGLAGCPPFEVILVDFDQEHESRSRSEKSSLTKSHGYRSTLLVGTEPSERPRKVRGLKVNSLGADEIEFKLLPRGSRTTPTLAENLYICSMLISITDHPSLDNSALPLFASDW